LVGPSVGKGNRNISYNGRHYFAADPNPDPTLKKAQVNDNINFKCAHIFKLFPAFLRKNVFTEIINKLNHPTVFFFKVKS
jgi:hypothetical protein